MTGSIRLRSIQVGRPQNYGSDQATDPMDQPWTTGFFKRPVAGPVELGRLNLAGDEQADVKHHGGPDKAVCAYSADHFDFWARELGVAEVPGGAFGENFTVEGLSEADVCIGDTWAIGEAVVQVSQPRQPCWKLSRRWRIKDLARRVEKSGRTGWYFRVLVPGTVAAGMELVLRERPLPDWTVARANLVMHQNKSDLAATVELAGLPGLAQSWRKTLRRRVSRKNRERTGKQLVDRPSSTDGRA